MGSSRVRLIVDVEIDDDEPIRGWIRCDDQPSTEFSGWLGLLASLDHLLHGPGSESQAAEPAEPSSPH